MNAQIIEEVLIKTQLAVKPVESKVTKIGNSLGIPLPQEVLDHVKVKQGDEIKFILEQDGAVRIKKNKSLKLEASHGIDQDFLDGLEDLFNSYNHTLRNLADR